MAMRGMREAVAFLTPVGGGVPPSPAALAWFPAVGVSLGFAVGGAWWLAARFWPGMLAGAIAVAVDLALTGLLHVDGLCDSADGLLPPLSRERRLEVMRDPGVGAFGIAVGAITVVLRVVAFGSLGATPLLPAALWTVSRTVMAVVTLSAPYARGRGGLVSAFRDPGRRGGAAMVMIAIGGTAGAIVLAMLWKPLAGFVVVLAAFSAAAAVVALAMRRLGGFTGDVLGAAGVVAETVGLVVAAARW